MDIRVEGLRVLVTAGASGIGRVVAEAFAAGGARVHICDISADQLATFTRANAGIGTTLADVAEPAAVRRVFADVSDRLGGLDALVNNAGIAGPFGPVEDIDPGEWAQTFAVNVHGMFHCVQGAVPMLKAAGGGSISNMSSIAGRLGYPLRTPYAASKWAVVGLSESLAMELGPHNIRVNSILPGFVEGERHDRLAAKRAALLGITVAELEAQRAKRVSLRRTVSPKDVAAMALFVASDLGRNVSGQTLGVCGNVETMN